MTNRPAVRPWPRALPALAPHIVRTTPWATLVSGCAAGTLLLDLIAHLMHASHGTVDQNTLRLTFLTAVAALAFVPKAPSKPVSQAVPVPGWIGPAGQILLSLPVIAATAWVQLRIIGVGLPQGPRSTAIYPLLAQIVAWCAVATAMATSVDRSRYADLGGALATPLAFAAVAIAWYVPVLKAHLVAPPASQGSSAIGWYVIGAVSLAVSWLALRDQWYRYTKHLAWTRPRKRPARST